MQVIILLYTNKKQPRMLAVWLQFCVLQIKYIFLCTANLVKAIVWIGRLCCTWCTGSNYCWLTLD